MNDLRKPLAAGNKPDGWYQYAWFFSLCQKILFPSLQTVKVGAICFQKKCQLSVITEKFVVRKVDIEDSWQFFNRFFVKLAKYAPQCPFPWILSRILILITNFATGMLQFSDCITGPGVHFRDDLHLALVLADSTGLSGLLHCTREFLKHSVYSPPYLSFTTQVTLFAFARS